MVLTDEGIMILLGHGAPHRFTAGVNIIMHQALQRSWRCDLNAVHRRPRPYQHQWVNCEYSSSRTTRRSYPAESARTSAWDLTPSREVCADVAKRD